MVDHAMNIVVRLERGREPRRVDAFEAVARAVLRLSSLPRAADDDLVWRSWEGSPRKLVRRARGSHWHAATAAAVVKVSHGGAEVLAFPPRPVAETPAVLRRLQVEGTDLNDDDGLTASIGSVPAVLWLNPLLDITAGKAMAQIGHGAVRLWDGLDAHQQSVWTHRGLEIAVRLPTVTAWARLAATEIPVVDGGLTEIPRGTVTVVPQWRGMPAR